MAATLGNERFESRSGTVANNDGFESTRIYEVNGETDADLASITLSTLVGGLHPTLPLTVVNNVIVDVEEDGREGIQLLATIEYGPLDPGDNNFDTDGERWEFDMVARTKHINAVELVTDQETWNEDTVIGPPDAPQNLTTVIGVDGGTTQGVDVFRPFGSIRVTKWFDLSAVDKAFRIGLYAMQNSVNSDQWFDWDKREALFLGSRIRNNYTTERTQITYNFLFGPTILNEKFDVFDKEAVLSAEFKRVTVGSLDAGSQFIYPFQFLWFEYQKRTIPNSIGDPTSYKQVNGIASVNLATVYKKLLFNGAIGFDFTGPGA